LATLKIRPEDHLVGKQIEPGIYSVEIKEYTESLASDKAKHPGSQNFNFTAKIIGGNYDGIPIKWQFNETAPGFAIDFFNALGHKIDPKSEVNITSDMFKKCVGCKLRVVMKNTLVGNKMYNNVDGYLPAQ